MHVFVCSQIQIVGNEKRQLPPLVSFLLKKKKQQQQQQLDSLWVLLKVLCLCFFLYCFRLASTGGGDDLYHEQISAFFEQVVRTESGKGWNKLSTEFRKSLKIGGC